VIDSLLRFAAGDKRLTKEAKGGAVVGIFIQHAFDQIHNAGEITGMQGCAGASQPVSMGWLRGQLKHALPLFEGLAPLVSLVPQATKQTVTSGTLGGQRCGAARAVDRGIQAAQAGHHLGSIGQEIDTRGVKIEE